MIQLNFRRKWAVGGLLVVTSVVGLLLSTIAIVAIWFFRPILTDSILKNLTVTRSALDSTEVVLASVTKMVEVTSTDIVSLQNTTSALSLGIQDTNPTLDSLMQLTGHDLPAAIESTQTSLASAQSSALLIDNTLGAITSLPIAPIAPYHPAVPLHTALKNVSTSLDPLKPSLQQINTSLFKSKADLASISSEIDKISTDTQGLNAPLINARAAIEQYTADVQQLKTNVLLAEVNLPIRITVGAWILTFLLLWGMAAQISWLQLGLSIKVSQE